MSLPNENGEMSLSNKSKALSFTDDDCNEKRENKEKDVTTTSAASSTIFYDASEEGGTEGNDSSDSSKRKNSVSTKNEEKKKGKSNGVKQEEKNEETEAEYRLRVYGTTDTRNKHGTNGRKKRLQRAVSSSSSMRRLSRQLSSTIQTQYIRRKSSVVESLPDTPKGWIHLITTASSILLAYELQLQKLLTSPPHVFKQSSSLNNMSDIDLIYNILTGPTKEEGILSRDIQPTLGVGTRGVLSSTLAYLHLGPSSSHSSAHLDKDEERLSFREIMTMSGDGAEIAIDWEIPANPISPYPSSLTPRLTSEQRKNNVLYGPISQPVVLILHGINNDASFGYIRSLMRACTDRGWIAAGMNFRGMGGMKLKTPRGYNGAYTGDLRCLVHKITSRMKNTSSSSLPPPPLFLVGNSLGANILTKYLGEEGIANTLPVNVAGGISLGNPLHLNSGNLAFPWDILLGLGVKKTYLEHLPTFLPSLQKDPSFRKDYLKILFEGKTIGALDEIAAPRFIRNETYYPYATRVGYRDGEDYWNDASSFHHVPHINVPFLKMTAQDDFLVYESSLQQLSRSLENPNVLVVKTKCGGHLGWQESPPPPKDGDGESKGGFAASWSDAATTDFIDAVIRIRESKWKNEIQKNRENMEKEKETTELKSVDDEKVDEYDVMQKRSKEAVVRAAMVDASKICSRL